MWDKMLFFLFNGLQWWEHLSERVSGVEDSGASGQFGGESMEVRIYSGLGAVRKREQFREWISQ